MQLVSKYKIRKIKNSIKRYFLTLDVLFLGMSTVHEVITARHCNLKVIAFSLITNMCPLDYDCEVDANHEEVMVAAQKREPVLKKFVNRLISEVNKIIENEES